MAIGTYATIELGKRTGQSIRWLRALDAGAALKAGAWQDVYREGTAYANTQAFPWTRAADKDFLQAPEAATPFGSDLVLSYISLGGDGVQAVLAKVASAKDNATLLAMDIRELAAAGPYAALKDPRLILTGLGLGGRAEKLLDSIKEVWSSVASDIHHTQFNRFVVSYPHPLYDMVRLRVWADSNDEDLLEAKVGADLESPATWRRKVAQASKDAFTIAEVGLDPAIDPNGQSHPKGRRCTFTIDLAKLAAMCATHLYCRLPFVCEYGEHDDGAFTTKTVHSKRIIELQVVRQEQPPLRVESRVRHLSGGTSVREYDLHAGKVDDDQAVQLVLPALVLLKCADGRFYDSTFNPPKAFDVIEVAMSVSSHRVLDAAGRRLVVSAEWAGDPANLTGPQFLPPQVSHPPSEGAPATVEGRTDRPYVREGDGLVTVMLPAADVSAGFFGVLVMKASYRSALIGDRYGEQEITSTVNIVVRDPKEIGPRQFTHPETPFLEVVPDLKGMTSDQAAAALAAQYLIPRPRVDRPSRLAGTMRVTRQEPLPGSVGFRNVTEVQFWLQGNTRPGDGPVG